MAVRLGMAARWPRLSPVRVAPVDSPRAAWGRLEEESNISNKCAKNALPGTYPCGYSMWHTYVPQDLLRERDILNKSVVKADDRTKKQIDLVKRQERGRAAALLHQLVSYHSFPWGGVAG